MFQGNTKTGPKQGAIILPSQIKTGPKQAYMFQVHTRTGPKEGAMDFTHVR